MSLTYVQLSVKSMLVSSMLLFFGEISSQAQSTNVPLERNHSLTVNAGLNQRIAANGTLNILAIMVEFQPDSNRFTSGNGTMGEGGLPYLENNSINIDPLPHNRSYFEAHLEFAKNYFEQVSGNQLTVEYQVLPEVYQLDHQMEHYSPTGESFTNEPLAMLARDAWQKVEENGGFNATGLDSRNTAFIIFHAGAGRDIELTGTTLDITPQDIPSLYLGTSSLGQLLDDPGFSGFPVNNETFEITNSLIIPQTLSRRGEEVDGSEFVLQLSTNGLICATIGSHLGLPDLFNTRTGASGIGRFGLMDGAAIFSYNGLFPPEPSAWEKSYLGWVTPFEIDLDSTNPYSLAATSLVQPNNTVAKYELSSEEYFLLENRHRDPENNGSTLTIRRPDGTVTEQSFDNSDETFVFQESGFEELFEPGVLTDVDNFDWSLPGGIETGDDGETGTADDRVLNGGILVWHIDEAVIDRTLSGQRVNANPDRRGVDLEEADGAQDIGRPVETLTVDRSNGWAFDFWWAGNNSSVITTTGDTLSLYENRFGPDTHPNNKSNTGAPSYFEFYDFSENMPVASFRARRVSDGTISRVQLPVESVPDSASFTSSDDSYLSSYPLELSIHTAQNDTFLVVPTNESVYGLQLNAPLGSFFDFQVSAPQQPYSGEQLILAVKPDGETIEMSAWSWDGNSWMNSWNNTGTANHGFLSSTDDNTLLLDLTDDRFDLTDGSQLPDLPVPQQQSAVLGGRASLLTPDELAIENTSLSIPINESPGQRRYTGALHLSENEQLFYLLEGNSFYLIDPDSPNPKRLLFESASLEWPAMADFDRDGRLDFLYVDREQNRLKVVNSNGAMLNSFPIPAPKGSRFIGTPLVSDLDGDQSPDLLLSAQDSLSLNIYAYGQDGAVKPGFPLFVGSVSGPGNQPVHPLIRNRTLYAVSHSGNLKAWKFENNSDIRWGSRYGDEPYNKVTGRIAGSDVTPDVSSVLVKSETYNWPNPAREETYIRYQTSGPGEVEIKIITTSGRVIFDRKFEARGGAPEEHRISTAQWGSGIYLARVTARVQGNEAHKLIKIAVVH